MSEKPDVSALEEESRNSQTTPAGNGGWRTAGIVVVIIILIAILAVAALSVTGYFSSRKLVETVAFIEISQPEGDTILDATHPITVDGSGGGLFEGSLVVQALDVEGNVLAETPTTIDSPEAGTGGEGAWSVQLNVEVEGEIPGRIYAYSTSPVDGSVMASHMVEVTFSGKPVAVESYIEIREPSGGAQLDTANPIRVNGMGGGLFEGNVVVQALGEDGEILAEQPTIIQAPEAGIGGEGPWSVDLNVSVSAETSGRIYAFSPSPVDGSVMAADQVEVTYMEDKMKPEVNLEDHLWSLVSFGPGEILAGTQITADFTEGQMTGSAGCNNYFASYQIAEQKLTLNPAGSTLMFCTEPEGLMDQEAQYLSLFEEAATYEIEKGLLKVYSETGEDILVFQAIVSGLVTYLQRIELPEDAVLTVQLADVSLADAPATILGEQVINSPGQVPIPFVVSYDPGDIDPRFTYAVQARITDGTGNLLFINTSSYPVITRDNSSVVEVIVEPVG